mmetsp:Transcript_11135/g.22174  ORF Transcript_11135/g.22174 Transcript_11135/m.22174 type:complete len:189 (-) Transcript_11135:309-875(-)
MMEAEGDIGMRVVEDVLADVDEMTDSMMERILGYSLTPVEKRVIAREMEERLEMAVWGRAREACSNRLGLDLDKAEEGEDVERIRQHVRDLLVTGKEQLRACYWQADGEGNARSDGEGGGWIETYQAACANNMTISHRMFDQSEPGSRSPFEAVSALVWQWVGGFWQWLDRTATRQASTRVRLLEMDS